MTEAGDQPYLAGVPRLETARLVLRAPHATDWPAFHAFMAEPRSAFLRDGEALADAKLWRSFCHILGTWVARGYGSFVLCEKGSEQPLGLVGPWHPIEAPEREIAWSIWVAEAEGKGYALEAARAALTHAYRDLGWKTAVSYIDADNVRSIALARRLGATLDAFAARPPGDDEAKPYDCLVFRHPAPEHPAPEARS